MSFPVDQAGPYAVGFREVMLTYDRPDGLGPRTVPVAIFYPADATKVAAIENPERPTYLYIESQVAVVDAPLARSAYPGGFPVVVHSHGHAAWQSHSYIIGEGLAALGVVFIAPGHVDDQIFDLNGMNDDVDDFYERVYDIRHTLDMLEDMPEGDPLRGRCNTSRVIMTSHSRGSSTTWAIMGATIDKPGLLARCAAGEFDASTGCPAEKLAVYDLPMRDERVVGGIPMAGDGDPWWFGGPPGMSAVTVPVLMMSASFNDVGDGVLMSDVHGPPLNWVEFAGGCHDLFASAACGADIDNAVAQPAIRTYIYAFARAHILGDTALTTLSILDGTTSLTDIVTFRSQ